MTKYVSPKEYEVLVVRGVEGVAIYINEYRICGPKPWGGFTSADVLRRDTVRADDLRRAVPELREAPGASS